MIQDMLGPAGAEDFAVWPDNWQVLEVFIACGTQWRIVAGLGGALRQGLDYPSVESVLRLLQIDGGRDLFDSLQIMELAALEVLNG